MLQLKQVSILTITNIKNNSLATYSKDNLYYHPTPLSRTGKITKESFITLNIVIDLFFKGHLEFVGK